jgi:hypothetical protein
MTENLATSMASGSRYLQRLFKKGDQRSIRALLEKVDVLESQLSIELLGDEKTFTRYRRDLGEVRELIGGMVDEFARELQSPQMRNAIKAIKSGRKRSTMDSAILAIVGKMHKHHLVLCDVRDSIGDINDDIEHLWNLRKSLRMMHESNDDAAIGGVREKFQNMARSLRRETEEEAGDDTIGTGGSS